MEKIESSSSHIVAKIKEAMIEELKEGALEGKHWKQLTLNWAVITAPTTGTRHSIDISQICSAERLKVSLEDKDYKYNSSEIETLLEQAQSGHKFGDIIKAKVAEQSLPKLAKANKAIISEITTPKAPPLVKITPKERNFWFRVKLHPELSVLEANRDLPLSSIQNLKYESKKKTVLYGRYNRHVDYAGRLGRYEHKDSSTLTLIACLQAREDGHSNWLEAKAALGKGYWLPKMQSPINPNCETHPVKEIRKQEVKRKGFISLLTEYIFTISFILLSLIILTVID